MIASSVKRCVRSVVVSNAIAPSTIRTAFCLGKRRTIPKLFRNFSTSDSLQSWLHLPMEACVRDARFDLTFKILFGEKGAEDRAISFLNAALRLNKTDRIERIQYLDRSIVSTNSRTIHFDVKIQGLCSTYAGHTFIVEMQKSRIPFHMNRWIYYGARELSAIGERLHNARASSLQDSDVSQKNFYTSMTPVKVIVITDFDSPQLQVELQNSTDFVVDWGICELKSHVLTSPLMSWTFVVLPRFSAALSASGNSLDFTGKTLEAWLYLMTRKDCEAVRVTKELVANDDAVAQGFYRVSHLKSHETESLHDERIAFDSQSQIRQDDYTQGVAEGEKKRSMDIAHKLHLLSHLGLSAEQISDITGCSSLEIKKSDEK
jgi:predicted transposase/invertase (TIGR01784 family)